jgi:DNA-binding transcriptional ArsR family regulator
MIDKHGDKILAAMNQERSVTELSEHLNLSVSIVSHCISQLKMRHCLYARKEGNRIYYSRVGYNTTPLSTGPGDPWGHVKVWSQQ